MSLPSAATKVNLDAATDDPSQARVELVALIDKFNALLTALPADFLAIGGNAVSASTAATCSGNAASSSSCSGNSATATTATNASGTGSIPISRYENGTRIMHGAFTTNGTGVPTVVYGTGFTVARDGVGSYAVTFTNAFSSQYSIFPSIAGASLLRARGNYGNNGAAGIQMTDMTPNYQDTSSITISFFVIGPN